MTRVPCILVWLRLLCLLSSQDQQLLVPTGDNDDPASKKQRGRPKGSKNRRTVERQDDQNAVSPVAVSQSLLAA